MEEEKLTSLFSNIKSREKYLVEMRDGAKVALYKFLPNEEENSETKNPIFLIPGFIAYLGVWSTNINNLVKDGFPVYVFESREKSTSTSKVTNENFNTEGMVDDVKDVLQYLKLQQPFFMAGNSSGASIILRHIIKNVDNKELLPSKIILIQTTFSSAPLSGQIKLAKYRLFFKAYIKLAIITAPILQWKRRKKQPRTYQLLIDNLKNADIEKMRVGLLSSVDVDVLDGLSKVEIPSLAIGYTDDELHPANQTFQISQRVKNGQYLEIAEVEALHTSETTNLIANFLME